jgi:hypothetical protein
MQSESAKYRDERAILGELAELCTADGYIHALAFLTFRDNVIRYSEKLTPEDLERLRSPDRLIRTEVATLIGLMLKKPIRYALPTPHVTQVFIDRTEALLRELHEAILRPAREQVHAALADPSVASPFHGPVLREAMFYGPDSAYNFQYRDLAVRKYGQDNQWLKANRGFTFQAVGDIIRGISKVHRETIASRLEEMRAAHPDQWTFLPAHYLTPVEVSSASGVPLPIVEAFLNAFAVHPEERNERFE